MLKEIWKVMLLLLVVVLVIVLLLVNVHGNSATADKLKTARNIKLQGAVSGSASFDGNNDVTINVTQSNIKVLTGTLKSGQAIINPFPSGFSLNNTIILSIMTQNPDNTNWAIGSTFDTASYMSGSLPIRAYIQTNGIVIQAKNISLANEENVYVGTVPKDFNYKIVIMKVS